MKFATGKARYPRRLARISRMLNSIAEKKVAGGVNVSTDTIDIAGRMYSIPDVEQGTGKGQRIGNKIFVRYWRINMIVSAANLSVGLFRFCVVWPRNVEQDIGDMPINSYVSPIDIDKWTIIEDRIFTIANTPIAGQTAEYNPGRPSIVPIRRNIRIFKTFIYDDSLGSSLNTRPYIFLWNNQIQSANIKLDVQFHDHLTFTDL